MAKLNKLQVWTNVQNEVNELLENSKVSKKFSSELLTILENNIAPKAGGGSSINPSILNDEGEVVEAYCRFHQRYEVVEAMVMTNGKSKGYCRASISVWNKANNKIKSLESQAVEAMSSGNFDKAQELAGEAKIIKESFNKPEFYDYESDWDTFNS